MDSEFFGTHIATREIGAFSVSLRDYGEGTRLPRHSHGSAFITIVVEGGFRERSRKATIDCTRHDVIVHAPGEVHHDEFLARRTRCLSVIGGTFERTALLASPDTAGLALKVFDEFRHPDELSSIVIEATMLELFVASERRAEERKPPRWLVRVRDEVERHFRESLTLARLAESVDVHPTRLAREFRRHYGTTVGELIRDLRIAYAQQALLREVALDEIAYDAGFADQSHFTRTFKRVTGLTPSHYRRASRTF
jgi:AraC family transcriptional regulator